jgi:hypothetical protein
MPDLLVKLYDLPACAPVLERLQGVGIEVRRAVAVEKTIITEWVYNGMGLRAFFERLVP